MSDRDDVRTLGTILGIWAHPDDEDGALGRVDPARRVGQVLGLLREVRPDTVVTFGALRAHHDRNASSPMTASTGAVWVAWQRMTFNSPVHDRIGAL